MMQETVQQRSCHNRVAKNLAPFGEAAIGGQDHCAFFVAGVDQLEEQVCATVADGQVTNFVDDQQSGTGVEPQFLNQASSRPSIGCAHRRFRRDGVNGKT